MGPKCFVKMDVNGTGRLKKLSKHKLHDLLSIVKDVKSIEKKFPSKTMHLHLLTSKRKEKKNIQTKGKGIYGHQLNHISVDI